MSDYIPVRKSQLSLYKETAFYYLSKDGEGVLYKKSGEYLDKSKLEEAAEKQMFIHKDDKAAATEELLKALNLDLAKVIASKGVQEMREVILDIAKEALSGSLESSAKVLPETIEVMFRGFSQDSEVLKSLIKLDASSPKIFEHCVNVLSLTMLYCICNDIPLNTSKKLGIAALLHDIGSIETDKKIVESKQKLSEEEFKQHRDHPSRGHRILKDSTHFDEMVVSVALEHHEKLDGSGYPNGTTDITSESQLIGLIDAYEALTYQEKAFRKAKKAFDSLRVLKEEVIAGKYNKENFRNFCACLVK